jgi:hypothetical protein
MTEEEEQTEETVEPIPELVDDIESVIEWHVRSAESTSDIVNDYTVDEINASASEAVQDILDNVHDDEMRKVILVVVARFGESVGSKSMVEFSKRKLEELGDVDG